jgi:hypothetical protein
MFSTKHFLHLISSIILISILSGCNSFHPSQSLTPFPIIETKIFPTATPEPSPTPTSTPIETLSPTVTFTPTASITPTLSYPISLRTALPQNAEIISPNNVNRLIELAKYDLTTIPGDNQYPKLSTNKNIIVLGGHTNTYIFDTDKGELVGTIDGGSGLISHNGVYILTSSNQNEGSKLTLWDATTYKPLVSYPELLFRGIFAFSPADDTIAALSGDRASILLLATSDFHLIRKFQQSYQASPIDIKFSPNGKWLLALDVYSGGRTSIWNVDNGQLITTFNFDPNLSVCPNHEMLLFTLYGTGIIKFQHQNNQEQNSQYTQPSFFGLPYFEKKSVLPLPTAWENNSFTCISAINSSGDLFVSEVYYYTFSTSYLTLRFWDMSAIKYLEADIKMYVDFYPYDFTFSSDGSHLIVRQEGDRSSKGTWISIWGIPKK